jgi:hypothetical protein
MPGAAHHPEAVSHAGRSTRGSVTPQRAPTRLGQCSKLRLLRSVMVLDVSRIVARTCFCYCFVSVGVCDVSHTFCI